MADSMERALAAASSLRPTERERQRQDSLTEQMADLVRLAEREGMYDAADYIKARFNFGKYPALEAYSGDST